MKSAQNIVKKPSAKLATGILTEPPIIRYTLADCPLGIIMVAATEHGVCFIAFDDDESGLQLDLTSRFLGWKIKRGDSFLAKKLAAVLLYFEKPIQQVDLELDPQGTPFQLRVWNQLRAIPPGETTTYTAIAHAIGQPTAVRAVSRACGANPLALVVPCHRVIARDGSLSGYRWGLERKKALLELEQR